jgi:hypothetical protein
MIVRTYSPSLDMFDSAGPGAHEPRGHAGVHDPLLRDRTEDADQDARDRLVPGRHPHRRRGRKGRPGALRLGLHGRLEESDGGRARMVRHGHRPARRTGVLRGAHLHRGHGRFDRSGRGGGTGQPGRAVALRSRAREAAPICRVPAALPRRSRSLCRSTA